MSDTMHVLREPTIGALLRCAGCKLQWPCFGAYAAALAARDRARDVAVALENEVARRKDDIWALRAALHELALTVREFAEDPDDLVPLAAAEQALDVTS